MQILVVEDDFISRRLICRFLEPFGTCDVAINGNEAENAVSAALAAGEPYELICLDIMMPGMSGQDALARIRQLEQDSGFAVGQGSKVIMTSALEDHDNIRQAFSSSADSYIVKPIKKQKLFSTLRELGLEMPQTT